MAKDRYLQAVRGAAITAVVLIHCLPQCDASVALRPLLNWAVAAFLFLSGLLTTEARIARGGCSGADSGGHCRHMWFGAWRTRCSCRALACLALLRRF